MALKLTVNLKHHKGICRIKSCFTRQHARGLCVQHYDMAEAAGELDRYGTRLEPDPPKEEAPMPTQTTDHAALIAETDAHAAS